MNVCLSIKQEARVDPLYRPEYWNRKMHAKSSKYDPTVEDITLLETSGGSRT